MEEWGSVDVGWSSRDGGGSVDVGWSSRDGGSGGVWT